MSRNQRPKVGDTVVYFFDGTLHPGKQRAAKVTRVLDGSGYTVDLEFIPVPGQPSATILAVNFAPPASLKDGRRPPGSWDYVV